MMASIYTRPILFSLQIRRRIASITIYSRAITPIPTAKMQPTTSTPSVTAALPEELELTEELVLLPPLPTATLLLPFPDDEGVVVGVYLTPAVLVQLVNLAVALPVIAPGVTLAVGVQYELGSEIVNNSLLSEAVDTSLKLTTGKRLVNGWYGGLGVHSAALSEARADDASSGVELSGLKPLATSQS